jgi:ribosomal-protein-alanine N-acetyltransferase
MQTLTIRPLRAADLAAVVAMEERTYRQPWSAAVWADEAAQESRDYIVAERDGVVVGYAGIMVVGDDAHVTTVVSDGTVPRLGTRLMLELVRTAVTRGAEHLTLEVRTSNTRAQDLYRQFGMAPVGVRKNYYRGEDALIMWAHEIRGAQYQARIAEIEEGLR